MESAQSFIAKQIAFYETQLRAAESRIAEFRAKQPDVILLAVHIRKAGMKLGWMWRRNR